MSEVGTAIFAAAASVLSTINLSGGYGEVQGTVLLASHSCAAEAAQECLVHMDWVLTPVSFGPAEAPGLYGSFTVIAGFAFLHTAVCCIVKIAQGKLSDTLTNQERWDIAAAKTLWPNLSGLVLAFFYQGTILRTFQNYFQGSGGGMGLGISFVTGSFSLMLAGLLIWYCVKKAARAEYKPTATYRRLRERSCFESNFLLPDGVWTNLPYLFRMAFALFPYKGSRVWFCVFPWVRMFTLGFFAAALADSCSAMYTLALVVLLVSIVVMIVLRPFRFGLSLLVSIVLHVLGIVTCIMGLSSVALPCPLYLVVSGLASIASGALLVVGVYEQRNYRPEVEALEQRDTAVSTNPLIGYL